MPSYIIDKVQLSNTLDSVSISHKYGDIKLLWQQYITSGAEPVQQHFLIYNALRGRNIFHGFEGKNSEKYFFQRLAHTGPNSSGKTIPHPWTDQAIVLQWMANDMNTMITKVLPIYMSWYKFEDLNTKFKSWFAPYQYRCTGSDRELRQASSLWPGFDSSIIPVIKLLAKELALAAIHLKEKIDAEHHQKIWLPS